MVRIFDRTVYRAVISFHIIADEYVVYPEIELVLVVGDSQPASGFGESIIQVFCNLAVGVRDGSVVEITADNDVRML